MFPFPSLSSPHHNYGKVNHDLLIFFESLLRVCLFFYTFWFFYFSLLYILLFPFALYAHNSLSLFSPFSPLTDLHFLYR